MNELIIVQAPPLQINQASGYLQFNAPTLIGTGLISVVADAPLSGDGTSMSHLVFTNPGYITLLALSSGTGINYNHNTGVITNTSPDQTVSLSSGTGVNVTGTYPGFTIVNTAPFIDAPSNNSDYGRKNGTWSIIPTGIPYPSTPGLVVMGVSTWGTSISGLAYQFVKADGSLDSSVYLTSLSGLTTDNLAEGIVHFYDKVVSIAQGTGLSVSGTYPNFTVTNTAPDLIVSLSSGTGISTSGTYPGFTIVNTLPDKTVSFTGGTNVSISGTYPNFTVSDTTQASGSYEVTSNKVVNFTTLNDILYPTVKAVNDAIATAVTGLLDFRGSYNASTNLYPATGGSGVAGAILKGDLWIVSVTGVLGGSNVYVGDLLIALQDTPGQTSSNWNIVGYGLSYVPENVSNKVTSISGASTDIQYPSAKLLYDQLVLKLNTNGTAADSAKLNGQLASYYQPSGAYITSIISDAPLSGSGIPGSHLVVDLSSKQDLLVSGSSIKTINSTSILGSGNITTPQGTVTAVSIVSANGVSGTSSGSATPALTISLGAITPSSVNAVVLSGASTPTLAVTGTTAVSGTNTGDALSTSTPTNFTGFIKGNGSVLSADNTTYLATNGNGSGLSGVVHTEVDPIVVAQTNGFTITRGTTPKTLTVALDANVSGTNTGDNVEVTAQTVGFTITKGTTPKTLTVALDANVSGTNTGDNVEVAAQTVGFTITKGTTPKTLTVALDASVSGTNTGDNSANSNSGLVHTTGAESIAGIKTFSDATEASSATVGGTIVSGGLAVAKRVYATDMTVTNKITGSISGNADGTASNVSGTPALPNGTTATTQAAGSNDTKLATDAYADAIGTARVKNDGTVNPTNLLSNGDFENWSAGASAAPDWWLSYLVGGGSVAREASTIKMGTYSAKLSRTTSSTYIYVDSTTGYGRGMVYWVGRTATFSCWVYCNTASAIRLLLSDGIGSTYSSYHTGNSTWQLLTVTRTIVSSASTIQTYCIMDSANNCSCYLDGAMCVEGESAFAFADKPASETNAIVKGSLQVQTVPSSMWGIDFSNSTSNPNYVTINNGATYLLPAGAGLVMINNASGGNYIGLFLAGAGVTVLVAEEVAGGASRFSNAKNTASKTNFYYESGNYTIQNNTGSNYTYYIATIRVNPAN